MRRGICGGLARMVADERERHPPHTEKVFAHLALDRAAARHAPHLVNPIAPTEENLMAGMRLFKGDCAGCQGDPNNAAKREAENSLYPSPPVFALHPPRKPDYQLFWIIKGGVRYSGMFKWDGESAKTHPEEIFRMKRFGGRWRSLPSDGDFLQSMPWPIHQHMTAYDFRAIYEYLSAISWFQENYPAQPR